MFDPRSLALYPDQPGVYLMKDAGGTVLYIGKAKSLRARLKQYYALSGDQREMVPYLTAQIETIDTIVSLTEKDALILENNLIKRHRPKYNILLKDDKTFISLGVTRHKWPMIRLLRFKTKPPKEIGPIFGPYTNALAARQTFDLISRLFPLRQCSDAELASRTRPCLLYDIKRCIAPCVGKCTEEEYQKLLDAAMRLLKGQDKEVVRELKKRMEAASDALEFEKANEYLRMIEQIEHVTQVQHVDHPGAKDSDVLGLFREGDAVLIALLMLRDGKIVGSEHFSFHLIASNDAEVLESFILQHYKYLGALPKEIIVPCELSQQEALEEILSESAGRPVSILTPQKGKKQSLIEMGRRNAKALFVREQDARSLKEKMLLDLQESLQLTRFPRRIECFDTSNISGTDPVASLASFVHGEKDKSGTRLFKIKGTKAAIFINSSQGSGERGKAGSKRSGPHEEAIAEGAMADDCGIEQKGPGDLFVAEQYRSGKAAAGRTPDEFMKVAAKADDYTAMKEVLRRHFLREKEKGDFCDLLIVDGGKAHLNLSLEVFAELGIASIDVIALAKEEARHDKGLTQERVFVPYRKDPVWIDPRSPLLFLLQRIRDEAHRLAIAYHRKRRSKRTLSSALDEIPGIGPMKKKRLLRRFGSFKAILAASQEELGKVKGLTKRDIEALRKWRLKNF